jgi:hypothetical protein
MKYIHRSTTFWRTFSEHISRINEWYFFSVFSNKIKSNFDDYSKLSITISAIDLQKGLSSDRWGIKCT